MKNLSNILLGIILIIVGVILGMNALNITNINIFFDGWWTLLIIIPCFVDLFKEKDKTGNIIGLTIGILLLLSCQNILNFEIIWKLFFPIILVIIGLSFIFKNMIFSNLTKNINKKINTNQEYNAVFSGQKLSFDNEKFKGCDISAIFGGVDLDLRESIIKEDIIINATTIFGGINIHIPQNINVKVNSTSIFGGIDNKAKTTNEKYTIYINAVCLFGGVEIK